MRRSCSCVDAMTMCTGRTITSSTCFFRPCHSSSVGLAGLGHMSRISSHVFYVSGEKEMELLLIFCKNKKNSNFYGKLQGKLIGKRV